jgi:hypothetical protein
VDIRCIYDFEKDEYDIACFEACMPEANAEKVVLDLGKLVREGKTNLISLNYIVGGESQSWIIQLSGLQAIFSTLVYHGSNLFIAVPQFEISYPACIDDLKDFDSTLTKLFKFRDCIERQTHAIKKRLLKTKQNLQAISHVFKDKQIAEPSEEMTVSSLINWSTPPRNNHSVSIIPPANTCILTDASDTEISDDEVESDDLKEKITSETEEEDEFGFSLTKKGWFSSVTGNYLNYHPFK